MTQMGTLDLNGTWGLAYAEGRMLESPTRYTATVLEGIRRDSRCLLAAASDA